MYGFKTTEVMMGRSSHAFLDAEDTWDIAAGVEAAVDNRTAAVPSKFISRRSMPSITYTGTDTGAYPNLCCGFNICVVASKFVWPQNLCRPKGPAYASQKGSFLKAPFPSRPPRARAARASYRDGRAGQDRTGHGVRRGRHRGRQPEHGGVEDAAAAQGHGAGPALADRQGGLRAAHDRVARDAGRHGPVPARRAAHARGGARQRQQGLRHVLRRVPGGCGHADGGQGRHAAALRGHPAREQEQAHPAVLHLVSAPRAGDVEPRDGQERRPAAREGAAARAVRRQLLLPRAGARAVPGLPHALPQARAGRHEHGRLQNPEAPRGARVLGRGRVRAGRGLGVERQCGRQRGAGAAGAGAGGAQLGRRRPRLHPGQGALRLRAVSGRNSGRQRSVGGHRAGRGPKHGVFARPHQVFLTMSGAKLHEHQLQQQKQIQDGLGDSFDQRGAASAAELGDEANEGIQPPLTPEGTASSFPSTPPPAPAPSSSLNLPAPTDTPEPSKLSLVLSRASVAHRRYLNRLLIHIRAELEEHERFENYGATASSADAVQYLQQLQNSAQDKIVLSDEFIQQIIQAQQAARES
ncbi:hypothetical protein ON010_g4921 [Phytophthora cinnamomi]|nr:hypothetical protein ON010_g4921 [Phytophthora cinnamomi]